MKVRDLIGGFVLMAATAMTVASCSKVNIEGSWVEPVPGMPDMQQGFTLESDGKATSINMATLQYQSWKQEGDLLILSGLSIGNGQTIPFSDTLVIEEVTPERLAVKRNNLRLEYRRSDKAPTEDTIPAAVLTPAQKVESVKGYVTIAHEVRSFTAEGDTVSYWIVDETGELNEKYDQVTKGSKNGVPVYVALDIIDLGKSDEGFAANYPSVYQVVKINKIESVN